MHRIQNLHKHLGGDCTPGGKILSSFASRCVSSLMETICAFTGGGRHYSRERPRINIAVYVTCITIFSDQGMAPMLTHVADQDRNPYISLPLSLLQNWS